MWGVHYFYAVLFTYKGGGGKDSRAGGLIPVVPRAGTQLQCTIDRELPSSARRYTRTYEEKRRENRR